MSSQAPSNRTALIGYTGFVGSNLARQHAFSAQYNSRNIEEIRGKYFDLLVIAGVQAKKWWANQHPEEDWEGIERLLNALKEVQAQKVILISTVDVYGRAVEVDEKIRALPNERNPYGTHRLHVEEWVEDHFKKAKAQTLVVRLPGLYGPGLKKNVIYDLLHGNALDAINPASTFQYYNLDRLWADLQRALAADLRLVNFATEPIATCTLLDRFFPQAQVGVQASPSAEYDMRTIHAEKLGGHGHYLYDRRAVLEDLERFIQQHRATPRRSGNTLRLAVSNIAWHAEEDIPAYVLLKELGITELEVAPPRVWPHPEQVQLGELQAQRAAWASIPLQCVAFQALLFARPELQLFEAQTREEHLAHLEGLAKLAHGVGARVMVYGSPKQRLRRELAADEAWAYAVEFFREAGERCLKHDVVLGLEANPPAYGGDFIHTVAEAAALVRAVNSRGFRLHLDVGGLALTGESPAAVVSTYAAEICHVHASEPHLEPLANAALHRQVAEALRTGQYGGTVSLEMCRPSNGLEGVRDAVARLCEYYQ